MWPNVGLVVRGVGLPCRGWGHVCTAGCRCGGAKPDYEASVMTQGLEQPELANSEEATPRLGSCTSRRPPPQPGCEASVVGQCWAGEAPMVLVERNVQARLGPARRSLLIEDYHP